MKICKLCGVEKDIKDFAISNTTPVKIHYRRFCRECDNKKRKLVIDLRKNLEYPESNTKCPICKMVPNKYYLDHDWNTGKFRGWLCNKCNAGLGMFNDNLTILENAKIYLTETS